VSLLLVLHSNRELDCEPDVSLSFYLSIGCEPFVGTIF
jgi:hypothetical protein